MNGTIYSVCGALMISAAATVWFAFGLNAWTLVVGALLLACPVAATVIVWRENRRANREIHSAVSEELRRRRS